MHSAADLRYFKHFQKSFIRQSSFLLRAAILSQTVILTNGLQTRSTLKYIHFILIAEQLFKLWLIASPSLFCSTDEVSFKFGLVQQQAIPLFGLWINHCPNVGHLLETIAESICYRTVINRRSHITPHFGLFGILGVWNQKVFWTEICETAKNERSISRLPRLSWYCLTKHKFSLVILLSTTH